jgi:hypothetical protein
MRREKRSREERKKCYERTVINAINFSGEIKTNQTSDSSQIQERNTLSRTDERYSPSINHKC